MDKTEVVSPVRLRSLFDLDDGDNVGISPPDDLWHPNGIPAEWDGLDEFDAVVFDLDGTLVDLDVDWPQVHSEIEEILDGVLEQPLTEYTRQDIMELAREGGRYEELDQVLTDHEYEGAETASELSLLENVADIDCPVGICTANAYSAVERALENHGLWDAVDALVARGTVKEEKPDPRPLQHCFDQFEMEPDNGVFIGDERTDAETAVAAGSSFLHPHQLE